MSIPGKAPVCLMSVLPGPQPSRLPYYWQRDMEAPI